MNTGYIKLYRKLTESRVFHNEGLLKVWIWCLLKANHEGKWVLIKTGRSNIEVWVDPGQFIFGRESAAKQLRMSPSTVWKRITKLKNLGNCDIKSDRQYSIISIINWTIYQDNEIKSDSKGDRQGTGKEQARNTNKNDKNDKNKTFRPNSIEIRTSELLFDFIHQRDPKIHKPNFQKWALHIDRLIRIDKRTPDEIDAVIQWCQADPFWQNNILSTEKLRKQFSQLFLNMSKKDQPEQPTFDPPPYWKEIN